MTAYYDIISVVSPLLTAAAGWWVGRRRRQNDFLCQLQSSIDLLSSKNKELMKELVATRDEVMALRKSNDELLQNQEALKRNLEEFKEENRRLRIDVERWGRIWAESSLNRVQRKEVYHGGV